jgi:undecaprenyl-diphosphatase
MTLLQAIILGIVQGLTEWLPISSTAHLRIVPALLGWDDPGAAFTAVIQLGTFAAVVVYFWRDVARILAATLRDLLSGRPLASPDARLGWMIAAGTVPIVICGLAFKGWIKDELRSLYVIAAALIVVALAMAWAERRMLRRRARGFEERALDAVGWGDAIAVGLAQAAALVPGTSRSGVTITGGLLRGLSRETAARFSFLLSLPSVFAAAVFEIYELFKDNDPLLYDSAQRVNLVAATVVSAVVGYGTIVFLLRYLRTRSTGIFIVYRLALGAMLLALLAAGRLTSG